MLGPHPIRRLVAFSLLALALFATYVTYLWHDADREWGEWNWEHQDSTTIARALGRTVANPDQARECAQDFNRYNRGIAAQVTPLIQHPSPEVRSAAARLLNVASANTAADLPALIAAHRRGVPILPAIAAIGTAEAVDHVATELQQEHNRTTLAWTLTSAGPLGWQRLATIYHQPQPIPPELHRTLSEIAYRPSRSDRKDFRPWLEVARDPTSPDSNRCAALELLALMDDDAAGALPELEEVASWAQGGVAAAARQTIRRIAGSGTLARLKPRLEFELSWKERPDGAIGTVEQIGRLGNAGRDAGPLIAPLLSSPNWYPRAAAATTLGRIGYAEAIPALIAALENHGDWLLAGAAAEALARLGAKEAVPALQRVASNHWYPPVRAMAAESVQVLSGQAAFTDFQRPLTYSGWYGNIALDRHVLEFTQTPPAASTARRFARRLSCAIGNTWDRACLWRAYRVAKAADQQLGRPDFGQAFSDGYLLGYNNGEWGGRIVYVVDGKVVREFQTGNVFGFYPMPFGLVVVTSFYNSGEGMIYLLRRDAEGLPLCEPLQRLPFEIDRVPHFAPITRRWNRELLILGIGNQAIVLSRSGELRMAD